MKELFIIKEKDPSNQFQLFKSHLFKDVPLIVPQNFDESCLRKIKVPEEADFAVASSGTTGKPKIYFRTKQSWYDFFPEQNKVFSIDSSSRIFINGSLAFTGNLNIAAEADFSDCFLFCSSSLRAELWKNEILQNKIDTIYMIPDKLIHLAKCGCVFADIKTVVCGSQFISEDQYKLMKKAFPAARIILYYGLSETSYVSYKILDDEFVSENCVGKIFDSVKVTVGENGNILVFSPYCVCGVDGFYDTKDTGFIKDENLYLSGRSDDQINIHGEKINKHEIVRRLLAVEGIEEAEIQVLVKDGKTLLTAHIAGKKIPEKIERSIFNGISNCFIPAKYVVYEKLPRNESGKISLNLN